MIGIARTIRFQSFRRSKDNTFNSKSASTSPTPFTTSEGFPENHPPEPFVETCIYIKSKIYKSTNISLVCWGRLVHSNLLQSTSLTQLVPSRILFPNLLYAVSKKHNENKKDAFLARFSGSHSQRTVYALRHPRIQACQHSVVNIKFTNVPDIDLEFSQYEIIFIFSFNI